MKRIKKAINGLIAISVAQLPLLFPDSNIMLVVFILGLLTIAIVTYCIMELINH